MDRAANGGTGARQSKRLQLVQPPSTTSESGSGSDSESGRSDSEHDPKRQQHQQPQPTPPSRQARTASEHQTQQTSSKAQKGHDQQQQQQQQSQGNPLHKTTSTHTRNKPQKHVVGGVGSTSRLHARVPSSKALHKTVHHHHHNHLHHVSSGSSTKIHQQQLQLQQQQQQQLQLQQQQQQQQSHHRRRSSTSPTLSAAEYAARFPFAAAPPSIEQQQQQQSHQPQRPQPHRRSTSTSDGKLHRSVNSSSTTSLVRRNLSATNLKRNRSHADVTKRVSHGGTRSSTANAHLKRTNSNPAVSSDRLRPLSSAGKKNGHGNNGGTGQVHFEIGSSDDQEDEWVDAGSSNVSGSRKNSLQYREGGSPQQKKDDSEEEDEDDSEESASKSESDQEDDDNDEDIDKKEGTHDRYEDAKLKQVKLPMRPASGSQQPPQAQQQSEQKSMSDSHETVAEQPQPSSYASTAASSHLRTGSTTRLLLPRTPPRGAPPKMSTETASATRTTQSSPDSSPSRRLQHRHQQSLPGGSGDRDAMTSRFITTGSHESVGGTTGGDSFYTTSSSRPSTGRHPGDDRNTTGASNGASSSSNPAVSRPHPRRTRSIGGETIQQQLTDDDEDSNAMPSGGDMRKASASSVGGVSGTHPRRTRAAPPAELSRTQQKLNLERASSNIDRGSRQHTVPAAGSLVGAGEFGMHDPRIGKLMEKTGMEYYMIRRYQNPVMRSLGRLSERLGGDRNWRIPAAAGNGGISRSSTGLTEGGGPSGPGHAATRSLGGGTSGLSQSFRERDIRRGVLQSAAAAAATNAGANAAAGGASRSGKPYNLNGSGSSAAGDPSRAPFQQQQRLSGASLVEGYNEDSTATILRNMWDKNLYLGTSQD
ncbi:hypothetical protein SBRCBS47491_006062 [Sporothrix bragantina]|uniref:Uncharacterized protein n=1 Tax=Sporothrix bragantina TaxID=671064 RepID=A0ABP0C1S6_9PEZI